MKKLRNVLRGLTWISSLLVLACLFVVDFYQLDSLRPLAIVACFVLLIPIFALIEVENRMRQQQEHARLDRQSEGAQLRQAAMAEWKKAWQRGEAIARKKEAARAFRAENAERLKISEQC